jgi:hypothetical protein
MSIDPLGASGAAFLQQLMLPANLQGDGREITQDLQTLLHLNPDLARGDVGLSRLLGTIDALAKNIKSLNKLPFPNSPAAKSRRKELFQHLKQAMTELKNRLDKLLKLPTPIMSQAATERYGSELSSEIDKIMSSSCSIEDKLAMLAGLMSDHLDKEIEKLMKQWTEELKKPQEGDGSAGGVAAAATAAGGPLAGALVGLGQKLLGALTGGASEKRDQKKIDQLQTKIQLLMDKKKNFLMMISNLMAAESRTQNAIIGNVRA